MSWRAERRAVERRLARAGIESPAAEARWLTERASGHSGSEWLAIAATEPLARNRAHLDAMVTRRLAGEPLQYVLGEWAFRSLDLLVDGRVLIPRPETEWVVEVALAEAERLGVRRGAPQRFRTAPPGTVVVDLGTGSGAIALALEAELPTAQVWATDASPDALAVARANTAGSGATRVRIAPGDWFDALPRALMGHVVLLVSNPPYVAECELPTLPAEVRDHEPHRALVSGPTGMEAIARIVRDAPQWLAPHAAMVIEIAPARAEAALALARAAGFDDVEVRDDLTGRARALVARTRRRSGPGAVGSAP